MRQSRGRPPRTPSSPGWRKYREVRAALRKAGWAVARVPGSHEIWQHPDGRSVAVPGGARGQSRGAHRYSGKHPPRHGIE
ncbi:MAG: type II toxin-antitoxin system HicA family toxin [Actinomycetota bacterium]|nr:type II toxin-antitoxin system HicA family toxin [Actinomycetota bacterium]